jgi:hypothetical protein
MRIAVTTVRGIRVFPAGVAAWVSEAATAGFGTGAGGAVYGVYIDGGWLTVSGGVGDAAFTAPHAAANSRAAALRSTRSNRLRQRGHQEGSPARRAPQFGHSSIRSVSDGPAPKLSLKRGLAVVDPERVNIVLVPVLLLLLGVVFYKKVLEPKKAGGGEGASKPTKPAKPGKTKKSGKTKKVAEAPATMVEAKPDKKADKKAVKARAAAGSGRMGSVL